MSVTVEMAGILVPREPEDPSPQEVFLAMDDGQPWTAAELAEKLCEQAGDEEYTNRWTVRRRLDDLVEDGFVNRKKHSESRVSYWTEL